jgi:uncharacterized membrane protein YeiB
MFIAETFPERKIINSLVETGQMTLSFYILHVTVGMVIFAKIFNKFFTGYLTQQTPVKPIYILAFAIMFYIICVSFSVFWTKKYKNGPLETLMRKISD